MIFNAAVRMTKRGTEQSTMQGVPETGDSLIRLLLNITAIQTPLASFLLKQLPSYQEAERVDSTDALPKLVLGSLRWCVTQSMSMRTSPPYAVALASRQINCWPAVLCMPPISTMLSCSICCCNRCCHCIASHLHLRHASSNHNALQCQSAPLLC